MAPETNHKFLIYGLFDPRNGELRYVGKSTSGLYRPKTHSMDSVLARERTWKSNWIRQLKKNGLSPEIQVLEYHTTEQELTEAEVFWISYYRFIGCRLTNMTTGGDGATGWVPGPEWREKQRKRMLGKRLSLGVFPSEETRRKLSESHKGKTTGEHARERRLKNSRSQGAGPVVDSEGRLFGSAAEAGRALGLSPVAVSAVLRGKRNRHHGLGFRYLTSAEIEQLSPDDKMKVGV